MSYVKINGQMSDDWSLDNVIVEGAKDYGENIIKKASEKGEEYILNKVGEALGTEAKGEPDVGYPSAPEDPYTGLPPSPPVAPEVQPDDNDKPFIETVVSKAKQFPSWGIGVATGGITYAASKSIIAAVAAGGLGWLLFDKVKK